MASYSGPRCGDGSRGTGEGAGPAPLVPSRGCGGGGLDGPYLHGGGRPYLNCSPWLPDMRIGRTDPTCCSNCVFS